jgi:hypothetical protein
MRLVGPITVRVEEGLDRGKGHLDVRLLGLAPLAHISGGDLAFQGEATRCLAELVCNPDAIFFNRDLEWRVLDQRGLLVAVGKDERRAEVRLCLDDSGAHIFMVVEARPGQVGRALAKTPWFGRCEGYEWCGGRRVPRRAEVGWDLERKPFVYWRARIQTWSVT